MSKPPKKRWTRESVLDELRAAPNLSAKFQQRTNARLYGAAIRYFGSWRAAVEAAGISYATVVKRNLPGYWDAKRCIEAIRELQQKHSAYVRRHFPAIYSAALRLFGGWKSAIEAAGYDYAAIKKGWTIDDRDKVRLGRKNQGY